MKGNNVRFFPVEVQIVHSLIFMFMDLDYSVKVRDFFGIKVKFVHILSI